jgi:hypothetical protein
MKYFLKTVCASLLIGFSILFFVSRFIEFSYEIWFAVGVGSGLAFFFVITGFIAFFRAFHLKQKLFSIVFVSSIFIRLCLMTLSLILLIKFSQVHKPVLLISLFGWYFIFQIWELISFNRLTVKEA